MKHRCNDGIFSVCESCKHAEKATNEKPCRICLKERKCPYFAMNIKADDKCSGCRWVAKRRTGV